MKQFRNPDNIHKPVAAYTHQIEVSGDVRWLILSGQLGMEVDGSIPDDPIKQFEIALKNVTHNLHAAKMQMSDLVKLVVYLVGEIDINKRRDVMKQALGGHEPCITVLHVAALATPAFKVEIDAWACVDH